MSQKSKPLSSAHGRVAALKRHHPQASERIELATRDLAAEKLADYVSRVVAEAPPLTTEQADRIAVLLRGGAA